MVGIAILLILGIALGAWFWWRTRQKTPVQPQVSSAPHSSHKSPSPDALGQLQQIITLQFLARLAQSSDSVALPASQPATPEEDDDDSPW